MLHRFTLLQKQLALVAFVLLAELSLIGTLLVLLDQADNQTRRAEQSYAITVQANLLLKAFHESISSLMFYGMTKNADFAPRLAAISQDLVRKTNELEQSATDFPEDSEEVREIVKSARLWSGLLIKARTLLANESAPGTQLRMTLFLMHDVKPHLSELTGTVANFAQHQKEIDIAQRETINRSKFLLRIILVAGGLMQVVLAIVSFVFFSLYITDRLSVLTDNTIRLTAGMPLHPLIGGVDEIAKLDSVFHEMARALNDATNKERTIVEGMPVGFMVLDNAGIIKSVNPRSEEMLKNRSAQLIGKPLADLVVSLDGKKIPFQQIKELALGQFSEFRVLRKDSSFEAELSIKSIQDADRELLICNILDVSERHEVERMKQEFVSIVSHDLKTPLTNIQNSLYLLTLGALGALNDRGMKIISGTRQEADRLVRLVTDLLDVARIEAGRIDLDYAAIELGSVITRATDSTAVLAEQKKLKVDAGDASFEIFADADRLVQVLVNFLSNAIKFSPEESTVTIVCQKDNRMVEVRVTDQGQGIPKEAQSRIFGRFEQVSHEDRKEKGGTGLGLAICKMIVEAHHGTIGVDSEVGKGSCFWFKIPSKLPGDVANKRANAKTAPIQPDSEPDLDPDPDQSVRNPEDDQPTTEPGADQSAPNAETAPKPEADQLASNAEIAPEPETDQLASNAEIAPEPEADQPA